MCLYRKSLITLQMVWSPPLRQTVTAFIVPRKIVKVQYPCHSHLTFWKVLKSLPAHIRGPLGEFKVCFFLSRLILCSRYTPPLQADPGRLALPSPQCAIWAACHRPHAEAWQTQELVCGACVLTTGLPKPFIC